MSGHRARLAARRLFEALSLVALAALLPCGVLAAQTPATAAPPVDTTGVDVWGRVRQRVSGEAVITSDSYAQQGGENRLPGEAWTFTFDPRFELVGGIVVGVDMLLSNDGSQLRQNVNQLGLDPHWSWGTAHVGDFSHGLSEYTTQGLRVRGGGLDLDPGFLRFSLQGGQTQRAVVGGLGAGPVFARQMIAGRLGVGHEGRSFFDVEVLKVHDDPNSASTSLVVADTLVLDSLVTDTIPEPFRPKPQAQNRPQENLVGAVVGQLALFGQAFRLRGSLAGSALTGDETSPLASLAAVSAPLRAFKSLMPIRLSTSGDFAYNVESELATDRGGLRARYEYIGPGYTSLGLGYVMNDLRALSLGGNVELGDGLVSLQGQVDHQNDNLLGQKIATTGRNVYMGSIAVRGGSALTTSVTAVLNSVANDAPVDTFAISNHALVLSTTTAIAHHFLGDPAMTMLTYSLQSVGDASGLTPAPHVTVHDLSASLQINPSPGVSFAPTLSGVITSTEGQEAQRNLFAGFRGQGSFLRGKLRPSASVTQSFTNGRRVFGVRTQTGYELPGGARFVLSTRLTDYAAFAGRAAFREAFITTSIARSF